MHQQSTARKCSPAVLRAADDTLLLNSLRMVLETDAGRCRFSNAILSGGIQDDGLRLAALKVIPYPAYLKTLHWQAASRRAKERAGNRCQLCNNTGRLETHHRTYARRGCELDTDLIVLCDGCHGKFHADIPQDDGSNVLQTTDEQELLLLMKEIERKRNEQGIVLDP